MRFRTRAVAAFAAGLMNLTLLDAPMAQEPSKLVLPTPHLRVGLVYAPSKSIFFVVKDADGKASGVTADLADAYARRLGVTVEKVLFANSGLAADALANGEVDVSFMPVDETRKKRFEVGPVYVIGQSTYMVTGASKAQTIDDVDRKGMRVLAIADTSTLRAAAASLHNPTVTPVATVAEAVAELREGKADAFALTHDSLPAYVAQVPGSHMVEGAFQKSGVAIMVAKGNVDGLNAATAFIQAGKADGTVRAALDSAGFSQEDVAQP